MIDDVRVSKISPNVSQANDLFVDRLLIINTLNEIKSWQFQENYL